jgi:hypothetical protein
MMLARLAVAALLLMPAATADTILLRNNAGYNGKVVSLDKTGLILRVGGKDGKDQNVPFPRADIVRIEFNDNRVNQGPPPELGAKKGSGKDFPIPRQDNDRFVFRGGGQNKTCPGLSIDGDTVKCPDKAYTRDEIWRVFLTQP